MSNAVIKTSPSPEEMEKSFREMLEDVGDFAEKMLPYCTTISELSQLAKHGTENDGALRLLMKQMTEPLPGNKR